MKIKILVLILFLLFIPLSYSSGIVIVGDSLIQGGSDYNYSLATYNMWNSIWSVGGSGSDTAWSNDTINVYTDHTVNITSGLNVSGGAVKIKQQAQLSSAGLVIEKAGAGNQIQMYIGGDNRMYLRAGGQDILNLGNNDGNFSNNLEVNGKLFSENISLVQGASIVVGKSGGLDKEWGVHFLDDGISQFNFGYRDEGISNKLFRFIANNGDIVLGNGTHYSVVLAQGSSPSGGIMLYNFSTTTNIIDYKVLLQASGDSYFSGGGLCVGCRLSSVTDKIARPFVVNGTLYGSSNVARFIGSSSVLFELMSQGSSNVNMIRHTNETNSIGWQVGWDGTRNGDYVISKGQTHTGTQVRILDVDLNVSKGNIFNKDIYNWSLATNLIYGDGWSSTFNDTYEGCVNNETYLRRDNDSYVRHNETYIPVVVNSSNHTYDMERRYNLWTGNQNFTYDGDSLLDWWVSDGTIWTFQSNVTTILSGGVLNVDAISWWSQVPRPIGGGVVDFGTTSNWWGTGYFDRLNLSIDDGYIDSKHLMVREDADIEGDTNITGDLEIGGNVSMLQGSYIKIPVTRTGDAIEFGKNNVSITVPLVVNSLPVIFGIAGQETTGLGFNLTNSRVQFQRNGISSFDIDLSGAGDGNVRAKGNIQCGYDGSGSFKSSDGSTGVTGTFVDRNNNVVVVKDGIITDFGTDYQGGEDEEFNLANNIGDSIKSWFS